METSSYTLSIASANRDAADRYLILSHSFSDLYGIVLMNSPMVRLTSSAVLSRPDTTLAKTKTIYRLLNRLKNTLKPKTPNRLLYVLKRKKNFPNSPPKNNKCS